MFVCFMYVCIMFLYHVSVCVYVYLLYFICAQVCTMLMYCASPGLNLYTLFNSSDVNKMLA